MQNFTYKLLEDDTYCAMHYDGNEANVIIPSFFLGKPVTILYDSLFEGHAEIESVQIPETVTDIGGFMFDGCLSLHQIKLPSGLKKIWQYGFVRSSIEEITLPEGIIDIAPYTFKDCKRLRKIVCNTGLKRISAWAFQGCDNLEEFIHGEKVEISPRAFE